MKTLNVIDLFLGKSLSLSLSLALSISLSEFIGLCYNYWILYFILKLDCLGESDEKLMEFGIGGLCNLCLGRSKGYLIYSTCKLTLIVICDLDQLKKFVYFV